MTVVKQSGKAASLMIRIAIFGVLGVLMILALLDFRIKRAASATCDAVRSAMEAESPDDEFHKSELKPLVVGSPIIQSVDAKSVGAAWPPDTEKYTWTGIFRTYSMHVGYGAGDDPSVEMVDGPVTE